VISVAALTKAMPRIVCSAAATGQCPIGQHRFDLCGQPIAPRLGGFHCGNIILKHDMMHCPLELEPRKPSAIQLGPCRPPVMIALAQQEPESC